MNDSTYESLHNAQTEIEALRAENATLTAALAEANKSLAWIRRKLKLPEDAQMFSGDDTIAGTLHVWDSHQHGYMAYIVAHKCDDKQGEIARQSVRIEELETLLAACRAERDEAKRERCKGCERVNVLLIEEGKRREAAEAERDQLRDILREISDPIADDPRMRYVNVQIGRAAHDQILALRASAGTRSEGGKP